MRTSLRRHSRLATFLAALVIVTVGTTGVALATTGTGIYDDDHLGRARSTRCT